MNCQTRVSGSGKKLWCKTHNCFVQPHNLSVCPKPFTRLQRDQGWLLVAEAISFRADCRRRQIGAIIVDKHDRIVSSGRNGSPPGGPSCLEGECPRGLLTTDELPPDSSYDSGIGLCVAVHAEANAIIFGDPDRMRGGTIYVTAQPCVGCQRLIDGMGMQVVFPTSGLTPPSEYLKENNEHR